MIKSIKVGHKCGDCKILLKKKNCDRDSDRAITAINSK